MNCTSIELSLNSGYYGKRYCFDLVFNSENPFLKIEKSALIFGRKDLIVFFGLNFPVKL